MPFRLLGGFSPNADNPDVLFGMARVSEADSGSGVLLPLVVRSALLGCSVVFMVLLSLGSARWTYFYAGSFWLQFSVGAIVSTGVRRRRWWYGRVSGVSASTRHCHYLLGRS